jgi:T5orf172 domain
MDCVDKRVTEWFSDNESFHELSSDMIKALGYTKMSNLLSRLRQLFPNKDGDKRGIYHGDESNVIAKLRKFPNAQRPRYVLFMTKKAFVNVLIFSLSKKKNTEKHIYVLTNPLFEENVYKIGYSSNPDKRFKSYKMYYYKPCSIAMLFEVPSKVYEYKLHKMMEKHWINGEFFRCSLDEIRAYISTLLLCSN